MHLKCVYNKQSHLGIEKHFDRHQNGKCERGNAVFQNAGPVFRFLLRVLLRFAPELSDSGFDARPHLLAGRLDAIDNVVAVLRVEVLAVRCSAVQVFQLLDLFAVDIVVNGLVRCFAGMKILLDLGDGFGGARGLRSGVNTMQLFCCI